MKGATPLPDGRALHSQRGNPSTYNRQSATADARQRTMNSVRALTASNWSRVQVGDAYNTTHHYGEPTRNQCLADLRLIDPRDHKTRIEALKGGLLRDSYRWILNHDDFQRWRNYHRASCSGSKVTPRNLI
jgi:hypothetical protein